MVFASKKLITTKLKKIRHVGFFKSSKGKNCIRIVCFDEKNRSVSWVGTYGGVSTYYLKKGLAYFNFNSDIEALYKASPSDRKKMLHPPITPVVIRSTGYAGWKYSWNLEKF